MGRILSIDYGLKRVGLAVTDPSRIIATALSTVPTSKIFEFLIAYFEQEKVDEVVIGMPRQWDNTDSAIAPDVRVFIERFKGQFLQTPITTWDERFTSKMAKRVIAESGKTKKARRQKSPVDRISATIILQEYMEHKK